MKKTFKTANIWGKIVLISIIGWFISCFVFIGSIAFGLEQVGVINMVPFGFLWLVPFVLDEKAHF